LIPACDSCRASQKKAGKKKAAPLLEAAFLRMLGLLAAHPGQTRFRPGPEPGYLLLV
jgi:hypothetical protein